MRTITIVIRVQTFEILECPRKLIKDNNSELFLFLWLSKPVMQTQNLKQQTKQLRVSRKPMATAW